MKIRGSGGGWVMVSNMSALITNRWFASQFTVAPALDPAALGGRKNLAEKDPEHRADADRERHKVQTA